MYSTTLVQHHECVHATGVVAACGPRVYSHDTQFLNNLQVFSPCKQLPMYYVDITTLHA